MSDEALIKFTWDGPERLVGRLENFSTRLHENLRRRLDSLDVALHRHIVADKLSGQVLKTRTGNLRRSTIVEYASWDGEVLTGGVAVGRTAWYGKIHEFGGTFVSKGRRVRGGAALGRLRLRSMSRVVGAPYSIHFPERSFMRTGLADMAESIKDGLRAAVRESL